MARVLRCVQCGAESPVEEDARLCDLSTPQLCDCGGLMGVDAKKSPISPIERLIRRNCYGPMARFFERTEWIRNGKEVRGFGE